ncbi:MAG: ASCH domain-containing protein [bacterium]|nr:ASCH domain-containing protein [bacterium]
MKSIKFRDHLAKLILAGKKDSTWRLFDDKDLQQGDEVECINKDTGEVFATAVLTDVREKRLGEVEDADFDGHERFASEEEMYQTYRTYYGDEVGPQTLVKIIRFALR